MEPGDIVLVELAMTPGEAAKLRPALVLAVERKLGVEACYWVAYGTSKRSDRAQPWQLVVSESDGQQAWILSGLRTPTVFCFEHRFAITPGDIARRIGTLHANHHAALSQVIREASKRGWH